MCSAVNETAFRYLKLIQEIEVLDFSFNMFVVSYDSVVDFFAAQAGQIYTPPLKPKKSFMYQWHKKNKGNKLKKAAENVQKIDTDSKSVIDTSTNTNTHSGTSIEPLRCICMF